MQGVKHTVQCHCILPQYRNSKDPVFHKFTVFSIIDDNDSCVSKIVNCNNCGAAHRVYDICKSELLTGKEDSRAAMKVSDFKFSIPESLYELLCSYDLEICDFEYSQFIIDNEKWDSTIVLSRESVESSTEGKLVRFLSNDKFRVESFSHKDILE